MEEGEQGIHKESEEVAIGTEEDGRKGRLEEEKNVGRERELME